MYIVICIYMYNIFYYVKPVLCFYFIHVITCFSKSLLHPDYMIIVPIRSYHCLLMPICPVFSVLCPSLVQFRASFYRFVVYFNQVFTASSRVCNYSYQWLCNNAVSRPSMLSLFDVSLTYLNLSRVRYSVCSFGLVRCY